MKFSAICIERIRLAYKIETDHKIRKPLSKKKQNNLSLWYDKWNKLLAPLAHFNLIDSNPIKDSENWSWQSY